MPPFLLECRLEKRNLSCYNAVAMNGTFILTDEFAEKKDEEILASANKHV